MGQNLYASVVSNTTAPAISRNASASLINDYHRFCITIFEMRPILLLRSVHTKRHE